MNNPIGCHVSMAGGIWNAPQNAVDLKCETFQIFTRSPHGGPVTDIDTETQKQFLEEMKKAGFDRFVIHAPYFINFGSEKKNLYHGSIAVVRQELERGSLLGADYVMFHPGSVKDKNKAGLKQVREGIKEILKGYKGKTKLLVEISAGAGNVVGDTFEEVAEIIKSVSKLKSFGGVCFDTQHAFGSGYDLRNDKAVEDTMKKFDKIVGLKFLAMMHINDSKVELGSHRDRHDHIADGKIGKVGMQAILKFLHTKKMNIPLILETKHDKIEEDIKILKGLRKQVEK